MTVSVLQFKGADKAAAGTTLAVTLTSSVTSGSSIHAIAGQESTNASTVGTVADNLNAGNYTALEEFADATSGQAAQHFNKDGSAAGSMTVTFTIGSTSSSKAFSDIIAKEIGGTSGIDTHNGVRRAAPGTGTNAITATALAPSVAPGLNSAWAYDGNNTGSSLVKTSTFNADQLSGTLTAAAAVCGENLRYTTTANQQALYTDATHGTTDAYLVFQALYKESGGAAAVPVGVFQRTDEQRQQPPIPLITHPPIKMAPPIIGDFLQTLEQFQDRPARLTFPVAAPVVIVTGALGKYFLAYEQRQDRPAVLSWKSTVAGPGILGAFIATQGQVPPQPQPDYSAPLSQPATGALMPAIDALPQFYQDLAPQFFRAATAPTAPPTIAAWVSAAPQALDLTVPARVWSIPTPQVAPTIFPQPAVPPQFDRTLAAQVWESVTAPPPPAVTVSPQPPVPPQFDISANGTMVWTPSVFSPGNPIVVVTPPPQSGGLLPGWLGPPEKLGTGMGPYKRPGQVFGEQDPPSPFMTSRADAVVPRLPLYVAPVPVHIPAQPSEEELARARERASHHLLMLLVLDEMTMH